MNWFDILKNAGLRQSQRQGISARQKDEDFIFEDEDEEDCTQKIIDEFKRICQKLYGESVDLEREYPEISLGFYALSMYEDGVGLNVNTARLKIKQPKTNKEKKAYCAFYRDFAQGRNAYPLNPKINKFAKNEWSTVDDIHSIYTKTEREDKDSPTSKFGYYASLHDYDLSEDKIDLYFSNVPEDAWT